MKKEIRFVITDGWQVLLADLGIDVDELAKRAELPSDLFSRKDASLSADEYFLMWRVLEDMFDEPAFALKMVKALNTGVFSPPAFAAYCSPDLNTALKRLQQFKRLVCPMRLDVDIKDATTCLTIGFLEQDLDVPQSLFGIETGFFVQLARLATEQHLVPLEVTTPFELPALEQYTDYFGVTPVLGDRISVTFSAEDAALPFLSENNEMWQFFEPGLRKCLSELDKEEGMSERVRSALLEMLPSGQATVGALSKRLAVSSRTLQRRLGEEGTSFKHILANVREELARHYITKSELPYTQISFLLGYEDPNSFFRAFNTWTGMTPATVRAQATR